MPRFKTDALVAGFGATDRNGFLDSNTLKWLKVRTMARSVCDQDWIPIGGREDAFCAKHLNIEPNHPGPGMCEVYSTNSLT